MSKSFILSVSVFIILGSQVFSQTGKNYPNSQGSDIYFPLGDLSFADEVISFKAGNPTAVDGYGPERALGIPDYTGNYEKKYATLGFGGEIIVRFNDNTLANIEGPDLYIFEIGPKVEPVDVYISMEGTDWISIGRTGGGFSELDIESFVQPSDVFRYVKLVDVKKSKGGKWPGADIDAIGAIGSSFNFKLNSSLLFESGEATLKDNKELQELVQKIKAINGSILVEGHTDNVGTSELNKSLSEKRAQAVKTYFISNGISAENIKTKAFGETNAVASNETEEGREKNRRVEIVVFPK